MSQISFNVSAKNDKENDMNIKDYLDRPYHIIIQHITDESGSYYAASVAEFDGCMSHGDTYPEAFENIQEAMEGWIETKLDNNFPVPPPSVVFRR